MQSGNGNTTMLNMVTNFVLGPTLGRTRAFVRPVTPVIASVTDQLSYH